MLSRRRYKHFMESETAKSFRVSELGVGHTKHWTIFLRPKQITLGSSLIFPLRGVKSLPELTRSEAKDLPVAIDGFEQLIKAIWQPARFNYVISGQSTAVRGDDPEAVHLHAFPRYDSIRTFAERTWNDHAWPYFLTFPEVADEPSIQLHEISDNIRRQRVARRILKKP